MQPDGQSEEGRREAQGAAPYPPGGGLREWFAIVRRHRWAFLLVVALVVGVAALRTFQQVDVFRCTPAVVEVVAGTSGIPTVSEVFERQVVTLQNLETQIHLMRSETVLRAAYEELCRGGRELEFEAFASGLEIRQVKSSFLVHVTVESPHPEANARAANAVAKAYIATLQSKRETRTADVSDGIGSLRRQADLDLTRVQGDIAQSRREHGIANLEAEASKMEQLVANLEARYDEQQLEQIRHEKAFKEVEATRESGNLAQVGEVLEDPGFQQLEASILRLQDQRYLLLREFKEESPEVMLLDRQIGELTARRDRQVEAIVGRIVSRRENADAATKRIGEILRGRQEEQQEIAGFLIRASNLEVERDRLRRQLDELVTRESELSNAKGFDTSPAVQWEDAKPDYDPVRPKPVRDLTVAGLFGILAGLAAAYLLDHLNDSIRRPEEITWATGLPVLCTIPRILRPDAYLESLENPRSQTAEALRILRMALLYSPNRETERRRLLVTSPEPREGKTFLSVNLATALAQSGRDTLLIDCDLRNPRLHKVFGLDNGVGLTNVFSANGAKSETRVPKEDLPNLSVLSSGPIPPNPAELLGGDKLSEYLDEMSRRHEMVVIDSPPAGPVADPAILSQRVDGVILVVESMKTSTRALRRAVEQLAKVDAPLLGVVINNVRARDSGYYYRYYYRYGYGRKAGSSSSEEAEE